MSETENVDKSTETIDKSIETKMDTVLTEKQLTYLSDDDRDMYNLLIAEENLNEESTEELNKLVFKAVNKCDEDDKNEETETEETVVEEPTESVVTEEVKEDENDNDDTEMIIVAGEIVKEYRVEKVTVKEDHNLLWGIYSSSCENGLACSTGCFALDITKSLKVGDLCELPETATTIRQSQKKMTPEEIEKNKGVVPVYDWLHF